MEPRPYQIEQHKAIKENYKTGNRRQVIVAATGTGKSYCIAGIPALMKDHLKGQTLVLAHRDELLDQNIKHLREVNPNLKVGKEKADEIADVESDIIVASVQTLGRRGTKRIERFNWESIDKINVDEAHHATSESYLRVLESSGALEDNSSKLLIGFTATPQRADGKALAKIFKKIVHEYSLRQAIEDSFLVDVKGIRVRTKASLDGVKTQAGDLHQAQLAEAVNTPERNKLVYESWEQHGKGRQTIVFTVDIQHAKDLCKVFVNNGVDAEYVYGNDPYRKEKILSYKHGITNVIFNCGVLTEGFNDPATSCIVLARPTKSAVLYVQMVGRGTRLFTRKNDCIIIDLVDNSSKHSLVTLPTLMGMNAKIDLKGKSLVGSVKLLEDAQEKYSHLDFSGLTDITSLESYIESVDLFNVRYPEEVEESSELIWHRSALGGFLIKLPNELGKLTLSQDLLDKWTISGVIAGKTYRGERDKMVDAFQAADSLIFNKAPECMKLLKRSGQQWHLKPASVKQINLLHKLLKGKPMPKDLDSGTAHRLISSLLSGK